MSDEEEIHIMQLAAVSTASIQNTDSSVKDRISQESPYWSVAYGDVCKAIDREIAQRKRADGLQRLIDDFEKLISAAGSDVCFFKDGEAAKVRVFRFMDVKCPKEAGGHWVNFVEGNTVPEAMQAFINRK